MDSSIQYIIVNDNPFHGLIFIGPFQSKTAAIDYGESSEDIIDWWIAELTIPDQ
jgi:hypothetical protein